MIIKKSLAIKAIVEEPVLVTGTWFSNLNDNKNCSVCAVGSVLRKHCFTKVLDESDFTFAPMFKIPKACKEAFNGSSYEEKFMKIDQNYLGDLSMFFERFEYRLRRKDMKQGLLHVIEATWPKEFEVDL